MDAGSRIGRSFRLPLSSWGCGGRILPAWEDLLITIFRKIAFGAVVVVLAGSNIYWQLLNPYLACLLALIAGWFASKAVEKFFIKRAYGEMGRLYGEDWAN
jgi:hypothetical protein